ncbi:unnamed protein product, partial [Candidula unifasciata]
NSLPSEKSEQNCQKNGQNTDTGEPVDSESIKGIFGWETVDDTNIPCLLRNQRKFVSVRIVERKLLSKYPNTFPDELGKKDPLVSYFITEAEASLLNEINTTHCDYEYGHNPFTVKDLIVDLEEFEEFFKIVKKTFPADVLAKINEEPAPPAMPSPVKPDLSQFCGWLQINNTVSPYIVRFDSGVQVKLVPVSVIVYAAGLLSNSSVDGLLPTPQECAMLNEACRVAGFDFLFGKNTRLISITEVLRRCQVQLFELPFKNPLQHARYLDPRTGQPSTSPLMGPSHPVSPKTTVHHQPQPAVRQPQASMDQMSVNLAKLNSYASGFPQTNFHHSQLSGSLSGTRSSGFQEPGSPSVMHYQRSHAGMGLSSPRSQTYPDKGIDNSSIIKHGLAGSLWSVMPRAPPPAHVNSALNSTVGSETLPITQDPPNTSLYQPHSLPPSPLLHSTNSPMPDLNNPMFRGPTGMSARSLVTQAMHTDLSAGIAKYAASMPGLPPSSQYSNPQPFPYGVSQFDSSLFKRNNSQDQRSPGDNSLSASRSITHHRTGNESLKHPVSRSSKIHQNTSKTRLEPSNSHTSTTVHPSYSTNSTHSNSDFSHTISACLVNGKSISCINVDVPHRKGRFCLVEAVSKLYFPTVVLKINLYECTPEEEAAFVQYYNLPVNRLKCNKIIRVDDLEMYFPQLNYMFTKCSSDPSQTQVDYSMASTHPGAQKRKSSSAPSGPSAKAIQSKIEDVVRMLQSGKDNTQNGGSNTGGEAPVIVIDDE